MIEASKVTKERRSFNVWMLVWAFSIFRCIPSYAQNNISYAEGDYRTASSGTLHQTGGTAILEQLSPQGTWTTAAYPLSPDATLFIEHPTQLAGTLQLSTLHIASEKTFTIPISTRLFTTSKFTIASAATVIQEGEIENRGLLQLQANATLAIRSPFYNASALIWAGTEEIDATSEVKIEAAAANAVLFTGSQLAVQAHGYWFGRLTITSNGSNSQWQVTDSSAPLAAQIFRMSLPASSSAQLLAAPGLSVQFGQDVSLTGGTYFLQNQSSGTGTITIAGHLTMQNANLTLNQTANASVISTIDLKGNLWLDATSSLNNSSTVDTKTSGIRFIGTTWQTLQATGPINHVSLTVRPGALVRLGQHLRLNPNNSVYASTLAVENGGTLDFGTDATNEGYSVQGQGYFRLDQGGTLQVTSSQGINMTGASGNVQVTDSRRTFNQLATFIFSGKVPQQTGNVFAATASGKVVIIDNPTSVTLSKTFGISGNTTISPAGGRLEIRQGTLISTPTADVTGAGKLVMSGGTYQVNTLNVIVPQLSGNYELTGGAIELSGAGTQTLRGGTNYTYHNVIISGVNENGVTAKTISTTTTVSRNLAILPNAILDISNKSLKGDGGLTMTGGLFRTSRTSGSSPELLGINAPYSLTGGTIEFYGSINGQSQSIRGVYGNSQKITYHHLLLTAAEANTSNELGNHLLSANFDVAGSLTVKAPAVLQLASNRAVGGTGNFVVEPGATLLYGSAQGIKLSGTGTSDGNIRVSGTRTFSAGANYGFIGNSDMVTGDGLPASVANLTVAKLAGSVTLSKTVTVKEVFTHKSGLFKTDVHELSLARPEATALHLTDTTFYIQGNLRRAVGSSGTYSFPVGNANGKRQFTLVSHELGGNGFESILVSFKPLTKPQDAEIVLTEGENTYTRIETEGAWNLAPNATPATGTFTAMASLQGFGNLSDNQFGLVIRPLASASGKEWTTGGGTLDAPNKEGRTVASGYAKRNFMTSFGQLAIGTMGAVETVLPVSWLFVKAERKNKQVQLTWATATEINNDRFEVEHSLDGKNFTYAGKVTGSGNSTIKRDYHFQHASSSPATAYYRLKQIDFDGKFEYSKVVAVQGDGAAVAQITLYPNPSQDYLHLANFTLDASATVEFLDVHGKQVGRVQPQTNGGTSVIPVRQLPAGNYILRIQKADQLIQQRFVKL